MFETQWSKQPLLDTLDEYQPFQATDARDKVFGLLNLVQPGKEVDAVVVDYKKSTRQVYADTAMEIIRLSSNLDVLAYVGHPLDYMEDDGFHSWAPRWDTYRRTMSLLNHGNNTWRTWDREPMKGLDKLQMRPDSLRLSGLFFNRVASVGEVMDDTVIRNGNGPGTTHIWLDWWNKLFASHTPGSTEGINAMMDMAMTLTVGWTSGDRLVYELDNDERLQYFSDYLALIDHLFAITGQQNTTPYDPLSMAFHDGDKNTFRYIAGRVCNYRRLFRMENGEYGLGPACMQPGDVVVIVSGGDIPYILRETGDGHFRYMGGAYVHSIMNGELVDDLRAGKTELQEYFLE